MVQFNKFIESSKGRFTWLAIMFFLLIFPSPYANVNRNFTVYDLLIYLVVAGMSWFAIYHLSGKLNLKYKKLWRILSIIVPFFSFLIFLIVKNKYLNIPKEERIQDSRKIVFIKLFSLMGFFIFIVISLYFLIEVDNYYRFVIDYSNLANKEINTTNDLNKIYGDLSKTPQKNLYIKSLNLIDKNISILKEQDITLREIKNNLLAFVFPETRKRIESAEQSTEFLQNSNKASMEWNKSALDNGYASDKTQNLLKKVENLNNKKDRAYIDLELTRHPSLISLLLGNLLAMTVYLIVFVYGLLLAIFLACMTYTRFKQKQKFTSLKWFGLFVVDILTLSLFILTLLYF